MSGGGLLGPAQYARHSALLERPSLCVKLRASLNGRNLYLVGWEFRVWPIPIWKILQLAKLAGGAVCGDPAASLAETPCRALGLDRCAAARAAIAAAEPFGGQLYSFMRLIESAECRRRELLPSTKNDRRQHRYNIRIQLRAPRRISGASVGGLVNPTPLVSGARKDLLDRQLAFCAGAQWVRFATLGGPYQN